MITVLEDGPRFVIVKPFQSADFSFLKKKFELSLQSEGACKLGFAVVCRRLDLKNLCFSFFLDSFCDLLYGLLFHVLTHGLVVRL